MPEPTQTREHRTRARLWLALRLLVTAGAFYYLSTRIDFEEVPGAFARLTAWALLAMLAAFTATVVIGVERWRLLMSALGATHLPPRLSLFRLYLVGTFYNTFLPGGLGGELVRGIGSRRAFGSSGEAKGLVVVLVERAMGLSGLLIVLASATAWSPLTDLPAPTLFATLALLGATAPVLGLALGRRIAPALPGRLSGWVAQLPAPERFSPLLAALLLSVVIQALAATAAHGLLISVGASLPLTASLTVVPLAAATIFLPVSVSGAGIFEVAFVELYALLGVPEQDALAACVGYRLCYFVVAASGGLWVLLGAPLQVAAPDSDAAPAGATGEPE